MNKRGLTLPILIIIIIGIGLLFTGLYTHFSGEKKLSDEEKNNAQISLIIDAAKIWVKENGINGDISISLCELEANDYIGTLINPLTKEPIPNDSLIKYENGEFYFEIGKNNLKICSMENLYSYVELDVNDNNFVEIPVISDDIKKIIIRENGNEVSRMYRNKKTAYEIIYFLSNNEVQTRYLIVRDTTAPTINLDLDGYNYDNDSNTIIVKKYDNFVEPKIIVSDNSNSNITNSVSNNVDTNKVGNYEIVYKASDDDSNESVKKINVVVKSDNDNENYYIDTDRYTNKRDIVLNIKGINTLEICVSNNSMCDNWIPYTETLNWTLDEDIQRIYVYYKTENNIFMKKVDVYLDTQKPSYVSSKKVLFGPSYNLSDIINTSDNLSGIKSISSNSNKIYKPSNLGNNKLNIEIIDNADNKSEESISLITYKNIRCDNSVSSVVNEDGLVKDGNRCIYIGESPNNYIRFNNDLYRIISIESDNKIKIIRDSSLSREEFNSNDWNSSGSKKYLDNYFANLNSRITTDGLFYYGDISSQSFVSSLYVNNNSRYNIYNIGLLSTYEFLKAGSCDGNTSWDKLLTNNPCKTNNWLYNKSEFWLINTTKGIPMYVTRDGNISYTYDGKKDVRPVLFLKANIGIVGGNGSSDNPFVIDDSIEPTNLVCSVTTSNSFDTVKTLIVNSDVDTLISFDGINWSNNRRMDVSSAGIFTAYVKNDRDITSCSVRLYEEYEYRYKECSNSNKVFGSWYAVGSSKESNDFYVTSKDEALSNYLDHYETVDSTYCNNCKWVTKYERKVESCKSFTDSVWSDWSSYKPNEDVSILIDKPRIKYGMR